MKQTLKADQIFDEYRLNICKEAQEIYAFKLMDNKVKLEKLREELDLLSKSIPESIVNCPDTNNNTEKVVVIESLKTLSLSSTQKKFKYPSNNEILGFWARIQPHVEEFNAAANTLVTWLELQKGKQETGNTFGSEVIDQITGVVTSTQSGLGLLSYLEARSKLVSKLKKYPESEDAYRAIAVLDYNEIHSMDFVMRLFDRGYGLIYDKLKKNWDTIIEAGNTKQNCDVMY